MLICTVSIWQSDYKTIKTRHKEPVRIYCNYFKNRFWILCKLYRISPPGGRLHLCAAHVRPNKEFVVQNQKQLYSIILQMRKSRISRDIVPWRLCMYNILLLYFQYYNQKQKPVSSRTAPSLRWRCVLFCLWVCRVCVVVSKFTSFGLRRHVPVNGVCFMWSVPTTRYTHWKNTCFLVCLLDTIRQSVFWCRVK